MKGFSKEILEAVDILNAPIALNMATNMAASDASVTKEAGNAIQAVADEVNNRLQIVRDLLEEIIEKEAA